MALDNYNNKGQEGHKLITSKTALSIEDLRQNPKIIAVIEEIEKQGFKVEQGYSTDGGEHFNLIYWAYYNWQTNQITYQADGSYICTFRETFQYNKVTGDYESIDCKEINNVAHN